MAKIKVGNSNLEVSRSQEGKYLINGAEVNSDLIQISDDVYHLILDNKSYQIEVISRDMINGNLEMRVNGQRLNTHHTFRLEELLKSMGMATGKKLQKELKAPMPGMVLDVLVKAGQDVNEGDDLIILEAMKMENVLKSPQSGVIESISATKNAKVDKNEVLISFQ